MKKETIKVTFNMPVELVKKVDVYAESLNINRTSAMCVLASQALEYREIVGMMDALPMLIDRAEKLKKEKDGE